MTTRVIDLFLDPGDLASRPAASAVPVGALYPCTDAPKVIYRNNDGTTWSVWAADVSGLSESDVVALVNDSTPSDLRAALDALYAGTGFSGDGADLTGGPIAPAVLASGTPASGKYLDGTGAWVTLPAGFSGNAAALTGGPVPLAVLASGTPAAGKYPDGAGGWTALPAGFSGNAAALTGGPAPAAVLGSGSPAAGKYLDGSGAWVVLPAGFSGDAAALTGGPAPVGVLGTGTPTSAKFLRGDGTWAAVPGGFSGDGAALTGGPIPTGVLGSGTADSTKYLRGDNTWATPSGTGLNDAGVAAAIADTTPSATRSAAITLIRAQRLDQMAAPTADVAMGTHKLTGLQTGTATDHGVNKGQMDTAISAGVSAAPNPAIKSIATVAASADGTLSAVGMTLSGVGSSSVPSNEAVPASTNLHTSTKRVDLLRTAAAVSNLVGMRGSRKWLWRGNAAGLGGFKFQTRFGPATGQTIASRLFVGLDVDASAGSEAEPSTLTDMVGVGYDGADTDISIMHNDSTGTATKVPTGLGRSSTDRSKVYLLTIECAANGSSIDVTLKDEVTGTTFGPQTLSTNLPTAASFMAPKWRASTGAVSSVIGLAVMGAYCESPV